MLNEACRKAVAWRQAGVVFGHISVNAASRHIGNRAFPEIVKAALDAAGLPPSCLHIELTESSLTQDAGGSSSTLEALRDYGVGIAVDDFGIGYSSLPYLKLLSMDTLKIGKSFITDIPHDKDDMAIAATIIAMAAQLQLAVVAEGIETPEQAAFLRDSGCATGQGYLFSRPVPEGDCLRGFVASPVGDTPG